MTIRGNIEYQNGYALGYLLGNGAIENVSRFYQNINMEYPDIFIANKAQSIVGIIQSVSNLKITLNMNDIDTVSFICQKYNNGKQNMYYENIENLMLIFIPKFGWYQISVSEKTDGVTWYKEVNGQSLEVELGQRILRAFQANSIEEDGDIEDADYQKVLFFNAKDPKHSLLHKILKDTNWNVGHVDNSLWYKHRSFDIENQDIYSFLTGDVAQAYNCIFIFDTFTKHVNAFDLDTYGEDTNIYLDFDNIVQDIEITCNDNNIKTCLYIDGGDNIDIRDVNINGTNKIYNFSYYKKYFNEDTKIAYDAYVTSCKELETNETYTTLVKNIKDKTNAITEIKYRLPDYQDIVDWANISEEEWREYESQIAIEDITDWTQCGIWLLETRLAMLKDTEKMYQNDINLYCKEDSPNYLDYKLNHDLLVDCEEALTIRKTELKNLQEELSNYKAQKKELTDSLIIENYFSLEQWEEISSYIREDIYNNDSYLVLDTDSNQYAMEVTQALYDAGAKELDKYCKPQYSFSCTIANLFKIPQFKSIVKDFKIGNFIRLGVDGLVSKLRLITIDMDFDNNNLSVAYSDTIEVDGGWCDIASIQAQASSVSSTVSFNQNKWDKGGTAGDYVNAQITNGINGDNIPFKCVEGNIDIGGYGIELKDGNSPKQAKLLNNKLVFTEDAWATVSAALGELTYVDPRTGEEVDCYGLVAAALIGNLIIGNEMCISNDNNMFIIDKEGLIAYSQDKDTVFKINPNSSDKLIEVIKNNNIIPESVFYISSDGDLTLKGNLIGGMIKSEDYDNDDGMMIDLTTGEIDTQGDFTLTNSNMTNHNRLGITTKYNKNGILNENMSVIELGLSDDNIDSLVHLRGDGYARFGLDRQGGGVKFLVDSRNNFADNDLESRDPNYLMWTKRFKIDIDGKIDLDVNKLSQGGETITSSQLKGINNNITEIAATIKVVQEDTKANKSGVTELSKKLENLCSTQNKEEKQMNITTDENGRISSIQTIYKDETTNTLNITWNDDNKISMIGDTIINWNC